MIFGRITANGHYAITVFQISPVVCHGTPSKRSRQPGDRGRVSEARLVFQKYQPHGTGKLAQKIAFFRSVQWFVMAPRPKEAASPATVEECQRRA